MRYKVEWKIWETEYRWCVVKYKHWWSSGHIVAVCADEYDARYWRNRFQTPGDNRELP